MPQITFILLTFNEEKNLPQLLENLKGIPANIFVVDSYSTDNTVKILQETGTCYTQNPFVNYSIQRNWAQENNPFKTDWVFHLDADERLTPELKSWLIKEFNSQEPVQGYIFGRRAIFMDKWIKSHYNFHLRLFRTNAGKCEDKAYDQHFIVDGTTRVIKNKDIESIVADNLNQFIQAHNKWALLEAIDIIRQEEEGEVKSDIKGNPIEKKRWLKNNFFHKSPLFLRSFMYFFYRYFIQLGILDGKEGLVFHVLQAFWFRFLIDAKVFEIRKCIISNNQTLEQVLTEKYNFVSK